MHLIIGFVLMGLSGLIAEPIPQPKLAAAPPRSGPAVGQKVGHLKVASAGQRICFHCALA